MQWRLGRDACEAHVQIAWEEMMSAPRQAGAHTPHETAVSACGVRVVCLHSHVCVQSRPLVPPRCAHVDACAVRRTSRPSARRGTRASSSVFSQSSVLAWRGVYLL